ncbi:MAG TPA: MarR family transcriptional regulator [Burkholderiaceae bacterium]|nr:MarR family transcriptional regulator [Burkholderiaceae bacterium]
MTDESDAEGGTARRARRAAVPEAARARAARPRPAAPPPRPADDELNNRLFFRLFQVMNLYERVGQREVGCSGVQGAVLGALSVEPETGVAFSELAAHLAVSRQNLDGVLKRLEKLGWIERVGNPDNRRIKMVRLTPPGRAAWDGIIERSMRFYRAGTRGIPRADRAAFVDTLIRIGRGLKAIPPGAISGAASAADDAPPPPRRAGRGPTSRKETR